MYKYIIFCFAILNTFNQNLGLVKSPAVEDNVILKTESAIRSTVNNIFLIFKIRDPKGNSRLKQSSLVHNYFVSLTLQDYKNLKEIESLSRVDNKNIDNGTENFIALLNNLLDEGEDENSTDSYKHTNDIKEPNQIEDVVDFITDYVNKLDYLKYFYAVHNPNFDVNEQIVKVLSNDKVLNATTKHESNNTDDGTVLYENEFWEPSGRRVYSGKNTKIKYFPFMASVQFFNKFQCAGSIIEDDLVITAASCLQLAWNNRFYRENPAFLSVRVGSTFFENGGESIAILEIYFHPGYNPKNLWDNLAIMRLTRKLNFKRSRVKKIDFDRRDNKLPMNTQGITILGWGAKLVGNVIHKPWENRLSYAMLDIYPLDDCQEIYSRQYVTSKHFCAGFISKGGGACNRDVGGPGIVNGILTGVISFGSPVCGTPDAPTVFTKLGYYTDWIEEIMELQDLMDAPISNKRTTPAPPNSYYAAPIFHITQKPTTFKIAPLAGKTSPEPLYPTTATDQNIERNGKLFKEFLKTMFSSKEVNDYIDHGEAGGNVKIGIERKNTEEGETATATMAAVEYTTKMDNVDPEPTNSEESENTEASITKKPIEPVIGDEDAGLLTDKDLDEAFNENPLKEEEKETEKQLENDIIQLIEQTDFGPVAIAKTGAPNVNETSSVKPKEDAITKIDESILTLLYLSDNEKANNNLKIPIDKNDKSNKVDSNEDLLDLELTEMTEDDNEDNNYDDDGIVIDTEPQEPYKDLTYRNDNSSQVDLLAKNVLYQILSETMQEKKTQNKTQNSKGP